jgi:Domain of unknown function (DUF4166)
VSWLHRFHFGDRPVAALGWLDVERGSSPVNRRLGALLRLPRAGEHQRLRVRIDSASGLERWQRRIGDRRLDSRQRRVGDVLIEYAGPAELRMRMDVTDERITLTPIDAALRIGRLRLPLPDVIAPHTAAVATGTGHGFEIDVRIWVPWFGLLIAYHGHVWAEGVVDG